MSKKELVAGSINHSKRIGNWKRFQAELRKLLQNECSGGFDVKADGFSLSFVGYREEDENLFGDCVLAMKKPPAEQIPRPVSADEHARVLAENKQLKADFAAFLVANQEQKAAIAGRVVCEASFEDSPKP